MFKNLIFYRIGAELPESAEALGEALAAGAFANCAPTEPRSLGWVPPRGIEHGPLVEAIDGQWIIRLQTEERILPACVIADRVEEIADSVEEATGRRPGRKAMKDLKEQATQELLPQAFTKRSSITAWIDTKAKLLLVDASSTSKAEDFVKLLIKQVPCKMNLHLLQTTEAPATCMAAWLLDGDAPEGFTIDRESELRSEDEMKSVIRYQRLALDTDEVRKHLQEGKRPTRLAMSYKDRVSFVLTEGLTLKKISFLDLVFEGRELPARDERFDADLVLATGELAPMIAALIDALGGELVFAIEAAAAGTPPPAYPAPHMPSDGPDPLYDQAVAVVREHQKASISLVQRYLQIGHNRAARLLEEMERAGVVSPMRADGARELREGVAA